MVPQFDDIVRYRPWGEPATGTIVVNSLPDTATVTVAGVVYTYNTDFFGTTIHKVAESLALAINAAVGSYKGLQASTQPIRTVFAVPYGTTIRIIAVAPGTGGNSITLATSDSVVFTVSGATLSGGAAAASPAAVSFGRTASTQTTIFKTNASTTVPVKLTAGSTPFSKAILKGLSAARTLNTGLVYIGTASGNDTQPLDIDVGTERVIEAPADQSFDLTNYYLDVATANDGVMIIYS